MRYWLMMGYRPVLKATILGLSIAPGSAYAFDYNRFYSDSSQSSHGEDPSRSAGPLPPAGLYVEHRQRFAAAPSIENNFWYLPKESDIRDDTEAERIKSQSQNKNRYLNSTTACMPSALSPESTREMVQRAARTFGVDPDFAAAVAWAESRFGRQQVSRKGALGPMQLMPGTAADLGATHSCDASVNVVAGIRYLRSLLDEFGNPLLAAAAYNAGPQAVREHHGVPPYTETVRYITTILDFELGLAGPKSPTVSGNRRNQSSNSDVPAALPTSGFIDGVMKF